MTLPERLFWVGCGMAAVLTASDSTDESIIGIEFKSDSSKWDVGTLPTGGSRRPRDIDATYFDMDGRKLAKAFMSLGPEILNQTLRNFIRSTCSV